MGAETNEPVTDRIEAIRARHADRLRARAAKGDGSVQMSTLVDDDMAVLLAEVDHWKAHAEEAGAGFAQVCRDAARIAARNTVLAEALEEVRGLVRDHWINLANSTDGYLARNYGLVVRVDDLNEVLAPVAPDAEPGGLTSACKCGNCYHPVIGPNTDGASCDWCRDCACPSADHTRMTYVKDQSC